MSEVKGIQCDLCKRKLDERPERTDYVGNERGLYFHWPAGEDICESCQRKMWLAMGRERGWRMTPQRTAKAPSVSAMTPPAKEPPSASGKNRKRAARKDAAPETPAPGMRPATAEEAKAVTP